MTEQEYGPQKVEPVPRWDVLRSRLAWRILPRGERHLIMELFRRHKWEVVDIWNKFEREDS